MFLEGVIISSAKTEYSDLAKVENHERKVRKLMQNQHKDLMKKLRRGEFDEQILARTGTLDPDTSGEEAAVEADAAAAPLLESPEEFEIREPPGEEGESIDAAEEEPPVEEDETIDAAEKEPPPIELIAEEPPAEIVPAAEDEPEPLAVELTAEEPSPAEIAAQAPPTLAKRPAIEVESGPPAVDLVPDAPAVMPEAVTSKIPSLNLGPEPDLPLVEVMDQTLQADEVEEPARITTSSEYPTVAGSIDASPEPREEVSEVPPDPEVPLDPGPRSPPMHLTEPSHIPRATPISSKQLTSRPGVDMDIEVTEPINIASLREISEEEAHRLGRDAPQATVDLDDTIAVTVDTANDEFDRSSPTSYSHVYRERGEDEKLPSLETPAVPPPPRGHPSSQERAVRQSNVFKQPLPGSPHLPVAEDALPEMTPLKPKQSGVYLVPGGPPQRPPHPDPTVRQQARSATANQKASSPQRYTAPTRRAKKVKEKEKKKTTGSYATLDGGPKADSPLHTTQPRIPRAHVSPGAPASAPGQSSVPHGKRPADKSQPPAPPPQSMRTSSPGAGPRGRRPTDQSRPPIPPPQAMRPPDRRRPPTAPSQRHTSKTSSQPGVTTRPPVIISQPVQVGGDRAGRRGAPTPTRRSDNAPRATPFPVSHGAPPRPQRKTRPPKASEPGNVFGSDLISERSLDEVILAYLAEDSDGAEE